MKRRTLVAVVLAVVLTTSTYAQTPGFLKLVMTGTQHRAQAAIDQGAAVSARSLDGVTSLMLAAAVNPNPKVLTTLLKAGMDIMARPRTARPS